MLSSRRDHAKKWQGELMAAIGESLTKFNEAQDGLLKTHVGSVQESLEQAHTERSESNKARVIGLDELQRDAATHRLKIDDKAEVVRKAGDATSQVCLTSKKKPIPSEIADVVSETI
jgi:ATP:corrinoid adenosyltransferase